MASLLRRRRTPRVGAAAVVALTFAMQSTAPSIALAQAPDPKAMLASGDKAARAKDWAKAAGDYEAANKAAPSADALDRLANARYQHKQDVPAYAAYAEWLDRYGASAPPAKRKAAEARLSVLAGRTGLLAIDAAEAGAAILVDDKPTGTTPLAAPLRLAPGPHRVRINKDGFLPFDQAPNVVAGTTSTVQVKLVAQTTKGRLSVREKSGKPIRVIVDSVDMGEAPWSGEVEAGTHEVVGRGGALAADPAKVTVERGKTHDVELVASSRAATLKIGTSDGKGLVYLDDKLVGEGSYSSEIPSGPHKIRVTREGYQPFDEEIYLKEKETLARSITLELSSTIETGTVHPESRALEGLYGGFGLFGTLLPGGMTSSMDKMCDAADKPAELTSCSGQGGGLGAGLSGFFGYHWDPVGVELFAGGQYDRSSPTLTWGPSSTDPGLGPDPARTEEFSVHRGGGFGAFRVRLTLQGEKLRFSVAGGVGLSYRTLFLSRDATATSNPSFRDVMAPDPQSYVSPVLSLEPSLQYRLSGAVAVAVGASLLVDSPRSFDQIPTTKPEGGHSLGPSGLTTPSYQLATGTQVFLGPFIGMMFGP